MEVARSNLVLCNGTVSSIFDAKVLFALGFCSSGVGTAAEIFAVELWVVVPAAAAPEVRF